MITSPLNRSNFMDSDSFNIKEFFYTNEKFYKTIYPGIKYNGFQ